jgi:hypothetical protein
MLVLYLTMAVQSERLLELLGGGSFSPMCGRNLEVIHIRMARSAWNVCWMTRKACLGISIGGSG